MRRDLTLTMLLVSSIVLVGWTQTPDPASETAKAIPPPPNQGTVSVSLSSILPSATYQIGPNDVLHIAVWNEPDLTSTVPVRTDGMISVPLLNDVLAAGLTPMQLGALLTQKLKKYIDGPQVTVVVSQTNSHRVYVVGEVLHSGPLFLQGNMTVLQALATAGLSQFANAKRIYVLRTENNQGQKIPFNYRQVIKGEAMSQNILLKPGDTIVVP
jgi:polysaccharide export outer membrane protein